jgi:hypothetical protein
MFSLRNVLVSLALFSAVPLSLAAPAPEDTAVAQFDSDVAAAVDPIISFDAGIEEIDSEESFDNDLDARDVLAILNARDESLTEDDDLEADDVLDILKGRATKCSVTSRKGKDCHYNECPPSNCAVTKKGNCGWKEKNSKKRPVACTQCRCYKTNM